MKPFILFTLTIALLVGCGSEPTSESKQDMEANMAYLDAIITDYRYEDGKYMIYFEHDGNRGPIKAKAPTSENMYKALDNYKRTKANQDEAYDLYDIMINGDDPNILGISPAVKKHERQQH
ncbi:hypothetical protein BEP19_02980 [Ammoniphilus oxalaticus]|uniref:Uncharacterized protein n=1 Tax=Ammoniphilus oxalaticus TaxID=66863 RepID=A0A419SNP2_9BACL|nr:hypothetical protein [Ammoniphilus oxalaticus]RKD25908.1 hypothetical protein BEP19_02980 [Ammoniphilus oxalaticus]